MNFFEAVNEGLKKAQEAKTACDEVSGIFEKVNGELAKFSTQPSTTITIERRESLNSSLIRGMAKFQSLTSAKSNIPQEYFNEDMLILISTRDGDGESNDVKREYDIAAWRQSTKGYPCSLTYEGEETVCFSGEELSEALKGLFSSVGFGKKLHRILDDND